MSLLSFIKNYDGFGELHIIFSHDKGCGATSTTPREPASIEIEMIYQNYDNDITLLINSEHSKLWNEIEKECCAEFKRIQENIE